MTEQIRMCRLHGSLTPHRTLRSIGDTCMPCLESYFSLHERFVADASALCDVCEERPSTQEVNSYRLCVDCAKMSESWMQ